ncbi:nucleoside-diphosphate sugar epimerase [Aliivibrio finisterrensis]|uniref:Nucleoside-diphosphate sugar epimerase n=1 Tax=Aliivibrio finisterrensis TaxID=511998 RepID=A0A4Q5KPR1_9GAMM|nr:MULTISPECIES: nucleoside-diphosphate sugar epimerase [Aliivibrio]MDD9174360.1 nucleoside-diphosphate sugar epimerase [Aliivibrio sp. S3TY1]MDD9191438.1 nucleoside-diphosphate sugar epimerase [Aliivibrio sp. S2TY2]RYU47890.1 nucleoside-diphosphate sugar epimerase [Aliivibrio finisterrensis]
MSNPTSIIIAGSTGLIGNHLLNFALKSDDISRVYSVSRRPLDASSSKLVQMIDSELKINKEQVQEASPTIGFITLGTTLKKAGSKAALKAIDLTLVVNTAKEMYNIGVKHVYVVSCIGASPSALSHYLKCKGQMETEISCIGFESVTFMQPGPLAGDRDEPRKDEVLLQAVARVFTPIMKGFLLNYKPIEGEKVAQCMLGLALENNQLRGIHHYTSKAMFGLQK